MTLLNSMCGGPVLDAGDTAVNKTVRIPILVEFTSKWETEMLNKLHSYLFNEEYDISCKGVGLALYMGQGYMLWVIKKK